MINNLSNLQLVQPFMASNDGSRGTMASAQLNQVIPLIDSEIPMVISTHAQTVGKQCSDRVIRVAENSTTFISRNNNIFGSDYKIFRDNVTGEVFCIKDAYYKNNEGFLSIASDKHFTDDIGHEYAAGEVIHNYGEISEDFIPKLGVNAEVVYQSVGENFEDAIIISESFAEKTAHFTDESISILVNDNEYLVDSIPIYQGMTVNENSRILAVKKVLNNNFMNSLLGSRGDVCYVTDDIFYSRGVVRNIFVYKNIEGDKSHHENLNLIYQDNLRDIREFLSVCEKLIEEGSPFSDEMAMLYKRACEYSDGKKFTSGGVVFNGFLVEIKVMELVKTGVGSKLTTKHAGKGLVTEVRPDSEMPIRKSDGKVMDIIINPMSVIGRLNLGQINEVVVGNCMLKMRELLLARPENDIEILNDFLDNIVLDPIPNTAIKHYYATNKEKFLEEIEDVRNLVVPINPTMKPTRINYKYLMTKYNFANMEEFTINGEDVENKLTTGSIFILKLKHEPELKTSYTSANKISIGSSQPVKDNRRKKNKTPASYNPSACGEMELMTLMLEGNKDILRELIFIKSNNGPAAERFMISQLNGDIYPSQKDIIGNDELVHSGIRKLRHYLNVLGMSI